MLFPGISVGELPILTSGAAKITPPGAQREPFATRIEMEDGLLLYRIKGKGGYFPIDKGEELPLPILPYQAITPFALPNKAPSWAQITAKFISLLAIKQSLFKHALKSIYNLWMGERSFFISSTFLWANIKAWWRADSFKGGGWASWRYFIP
jgi:hypothetical protein